MNSNSFPILSIEIIPIIFVNNLLTALQAVHFSIMDDITGSVCKNFSAFNTFFPLYAKRNNAKYKSGNSNNKCPGMPICFPFEVFI